MADRTSRTYNTAVFVARAGQPHLGNPGLRLHLAFALGSVLVAATVAATAFFAHLGPWHEDPLPVFWPAPTFNLNDQLGRPFGSADLAGRAALFSFVYTNCPDVCPVLTSNMAQVQSKLRAQGLLGSKVELVSITVDPRRDTPPVLADYAARYNADPDAWRFLSGVPDDIFQVLWGFKLNTVEVARAFEDADVVPHSSRFVLVDSTGQVRAQPAGDQTPTDEIVRMIERVLT